LWPDSAAISIAIMQATITDLCLIQSEPRQLLVTVSNVERFAVRVGVFEQFPHNFPSFLPSYIVSDVSVVVVVVAVQIRSRVQVGYNFTATACVLANDGREFDDNQYDLIDLRAHADNKNIRIEPLKKGQQQQQQQQQQTSENSSSSPSGRRKVACRGRQFLVIGAVPGVSIVTFTASRMHATLPSRIVSDPYEVQVGV
jgi:hypothetical protein